MTKDNLSNVNLIKKMIPTYHFMQAFCLVNSWFTISLKRDFQAWNNVKMHAV